MNRNFVFVGVLACLSILLISVAFWGITQPVVAQDEDPIAANAQSMIEEGRQTFRYDTFGDEAFWGDTLQLHQAIQGARFGGVGPGVSPKAALAVGLKVDR